MDPLAQLPAEIVLRIIDFTSPVEVARLTRLTKPWHEFIEKTHQVAIYSSTSMVDRPLDCRSFSYLDNLQSFARFFEGVTGWKDVCKRQQLLKRNWRSERPVTRESVIQVGGDPVWRFRPDFKRRFIVSTSQAGGINVTDMDNGSLLWSIDKDNVRPYAHLEYQDGTACWDRWGSSIEVWRHDESQRGTFRRTAILSHDCETRGFQISFNTLCVASSEGEGFVYDLTQDPPPLRTHIEIETEAVGHLFQSEDAVMFSIGKKGFHLHSKDNGEIMGVLQPNTCSNVYYIQHPDAEPNSQIVQAAGHGASNTIFPPQRPSTERLKPLTIQKGAHPNRPGAEVSLVDDEWGAGMIQDNFAVGVSRGGRTFICSDWRGALASAERAATTSAIVECESDGSNFDLGGWLSIKNNHILFEVNDRIYIMTLNTESLLPQPGDKTTPAWATATSSAPQLDVPVSFMAVYDDCLMSTYTTLGWRTEHDAGRVDRPHRPRAFATKSIRIISFAPELDAKAKLWEKPAKENEEESVNTWRNLLTDTYYQ